MATLKESLRKFASALGGQKGSTAVTNDRYYKELRDLVSQVGGKITLRNSDLEERGGEQNHHDYLYEVELDQRSELRFRGARCFDGSREVADFNYNKLSEKQKELLTADIRDRLSMYARSAVSARDEAIEAIRERLITPDMKALTTEESYVIDRYLYYNRSIGGSDSELTKLTDEAISKAGRNISPERIGEVRAELRDFNPEIKYHFDLWNWQAKDLPEEPHFGGDKAMKEKFEELVSIAKQHVTGKGLQTGIKWLEDSFNEYLDMTDKTPGYGMGGQPGSMHNREVLAEKILLKLGHHIGGEGAINADQEARLKESLSSIVNEKNQNSLKL